MDQACLLAISVHVLSVRFVCSRANSENTVYGGPKPGARRRASGARPSGSAAVYRRLIGAMCLKTERPITLKRGGYAGVGLRIILEP